MTEAGTDGPVGADGLAAAVLACPDVVALSAGPFGQFLSYLPGRTVAGVQSDAHHVDVHVIARFGPTMVCVGDQIQRAVAPLLQGRPLSITVDDLQVDDTPP